MKLNQLNINSEELKKNGLDEIRLSKLSNVVAFVGRNGSGKSRILKSIPLINHNLTLFDFLDDSVSCIPPYEKKLLEPYFKYKDLHKQVIKHEMETNNILEDVHKRRQRLLFQNNLNTQIAHFSNESKNEFLQQKNNYTNINHELKNRLSKYFKVIDYRIIRDLKSKMELENNSGSFEDVIESVTEDVIVDEFDMIQKSALTYLSKLPHLLLADKDDCYGDESKFNKRASFKKFYVLKRIFESLIKKDLDWTKVNSDQKVTEDGVVTHKKGIWLVNNREFNYSEFSDGEKTLFAYVLLFFLIELNPGIQIRDSILIIDEPELHLHPESEIELIDGIRNIIGNTGQLWIATHSLNILSHLNQEEIFIVKNGKISHPNESTPENSLNELMGLEERVKKLGEFMSSISDWAYFNFMTQCFFDPEVIDHAIDRDPQLEVFKKSIQTTGASTLLDFGAGKGRLFERLKADENFSNLDYSALEPYKELHSDLKKVGVKTIYDDYMKLSEGIFDQIVLCNVLHEIPITEMVSTFNKIIKALKNDGYLVVIEDRYLPKGEKIGTTGFVLMEEPELKELFNLKKFPHIIESNIPKYKDRIMCAVIKKEELPDRITKDNLLKALNSLKANSIKRIKDLRTTDKKDSQLKGLSKGRRSGLYSQLYINADLSIESLSNL